MICGATAHPAGIGVELLTRTGTAASDATIFALVAADGTAAAPWPAALLGPAMSLTDLADAVHAICALHASAPGIIEMALKSAEQTPFLELLAEAAAAFVRERMALAALTAAVGPLPSTPGHAECEAAIAGQQHALTMLAQSGRAGCAIGAALAFVCDWHAIRPILNVAAARVGAAPIPHAVTDPEGIATHLRNKPQPTGTERAMTFGAQQLLAQHRGLWQLLDARASARRSR